MRLIGGNFSRRKKYDFSPDFGEKNYEFQVGIQRKNMIFSPDFGGKIMNFRWGYKGINI